MLIDASLHMLSEAAFKVSGTVICAHAVKCSAMLAAGVKELPGALQDCTVVLLMPQGVFGSAAGKRGTIKADFFSSGALDALAAALHVCLVILSYVLCQSSSEAADASVPMSLCTQLAPACRGRRSACQGLTSDDLV